MEVIQQEYKDTKIGRIPKDWKVERINEVLSKSCLGGNYENSESEEGIPLIKMGNIGRGKIKLDKVQNTPESFNYDNKHILLNGDLLFNTRNTLELVGKVAIWRNELPIALYNSNLLKMDFNKSKVYSTEFMNYVFNSNYAIRKLRGLATGTTSVAAIYNKDLFKFRVPLPPLPEQQKIADILSTVDEQISTTQAIIDKSKELKKGLMQKLFSEGIGHTEFKDTKIGRIPKDWEVVMLKDVCKVVTSGFSFDVFEKSKLDDGVEVLFTKVSDMNLVGNERIITNSVNKGLFSNEFVSSNSVLKPNSLIFPKRGAAIKTNKKRINGKHIILDPNLIAVSFDDEGTVNYLFTYYYFVNFDLMKIVEDGTIPQINKRDIEPFKIPLPPLAEQQKIAEILSGADAKIEKEEQEKAQLEELKKGLMQQLLTGQKRVKV